MDMGPKADTSGGPPTYREGGYPPNPPTSTWWRVFSKTHCVEVFFSVYFFFFSSMFTMFAVVLYCTGVVFHSNRT